MTRSSLIATLVLSASLFHSAPLKAQSTQDQCRGLPLIIRIALLLLTSFSVALLQSTGLHAQQTWGVYSEHAAQAQDLSCWVCRATAAGTARCLGISLLPNTSWPTREQASASACVLKRTGKCLVAQNYSCETGKRYK